MDRLLKGGEGGGSDFLQSGDAAIGDLGLGAVKSAREREAYRKRLESQPQTVTNEWFDLAKREANVKEGQIFDAEVYGDRVLKPYFEGHVTLQRLWCMLASIYRHQMSNQHARETAQTTVCLKATAQGLVQKGLWKGAWELTYLREIGESEGGVGLDERASLSQ